MRSCAMMVAGLFLIVVACGNEAPDASAKSTSRASTQKGTSNVDVCTLLTSEEIEAAAGWKPDSADAQTYGSTRTCNYRGPSPTQSVVLVVATPVPKLANSAAMAEWRTKQVQRQPDLKVVVTPVEGLGVPAIRSEIDGSATPTVEAAVNGKLLGVTASSFEVARALAPKAIARLR